jgi:hypothetical protein
VHSDLEAFWPHPELADEEGRRPDFFSRYNVAYTASAKEAQVYGTFNAYFFSQNLGPIVDCLAKELSLPRDQVSRAVRERLVDGVEKRREAVESQPVLAEFKSYLR